MALTDMTGRVFGNWTVLYEVTGKRWGRRFACRCTCGAEGLVYYNNLKRAHYLGVDSHCRKCSPHLARIDRTGMQFGRWTILREVGRRGPIIVYRCRCACGQENDVAYSNMLSGASSQCRRCQYAAMVKWVPGTTVGKNVVLARDGHRAKVACAECGRRRWLQSISRYNVSCICGRRPLQKDKYGRMFTINGETHNMSEWARRLGISREGVRLRLKKGVQLEIALTAPRGGATAS